MNGDRPIAVEARIRGRVQGVWFRAWTRGEAQALGLSGWVQNEADGTVRALFVGPRRAVDEMLARCRDGPPLADVAAVETSPVTSVPALEGFRVRR
jgi:acylphosphatase